MKKSEIRITKDKKKSAIYKYEFELSPYFSSLSAMQENMDRVNKRDINCAINIEQFCINFVNKWMPIYMNVII